MVRLACISDTHDNFPFIPTCDILIHAGDLTCRGTVQDMERGLLWLSKQSAEYVVYVPGNHDWLAQSDPHLVKDICDSYGITLLIDKTVRLCGLDIHGSPRTPAFGDWAFMHEEDVLLNYWYRIPTDLDILVTHGPAYSILDKNIRGTNCGSHTLLDTLKKSKIKHHIFGHIHMHNGMFMTDFGTLAINATLCNEQYQCINPIQMLNI